MPSRNNRVERKSKKTTEDKIGRKEERKKRKNYVWNTYFEQA